MHAPCRRAAAHYTLIRLPTSHRPSPKFRAFVILAADAAAAASCIKHITYTYIKSAFSERKGEGGGSVEGGGRIKHRQRKGGAARRGSRDRNPVAVSTLFSEIKFKSTRPPSHPLPSLLSPSLSLFLSFRSFSFVRPD